MQFERGIEFSEYPILKGFTGRDHIKSCVLRADALAAQNEVQVLRFTNPAKGGTFTLTYNGQTTAGIAYNATAATIATALIALSNIGAGEVVGVSGTAPGDVLIEFAAGKAASVQNLMTADPSGLEQSGLEPPEARVLRRQIGRPAAGPDIDGRYTYYEGTILCKEPGKNYSMPYSGGGEQTIIGILGQRVEMFGNVSPQYDRPANAFYHEAVFDKTRIIGFATYKTALEAALPTCLFE
jgi:hypothetical protein